MSSPSPNPAPSWATRTLMEDGAIVHEHLCHAHPLVADRSPNGVVVRERPTEVSLSVIDIRVGDTWVRSEPTIQVEGGSYSLNAVLQLQKALRETMAAVAAATAEEGNRAAQSWIQP